MIEYIESSRAKHNDVVSVAWRASGGISHVRVGRPDGCARPELGCVDRLLQRTLAVAVSLLGGRDVDGGSQCALLRTAHHQDQRRDEGRPLLMETTWRVRGACGIPHATRSCNRTKFSLKQHS